VVVGVGYGFYALDGTKTVERSPVKIRIVSAGDGQVIGPATSHRDWVAGIYIGGGGCPGCGWIDRNRVAIIIGNDLPRLVRVLRGWNRRQLVELVLQREVGPFGSDIGEGGDGVPEQIALHIQVP